MRGACELEHMAPILFFKKLYLKLVQFIGLNNTLLSSEFPTKIILTRGLETSKNHTGKFFSKEMFSKNWISTILPTFWTVSKKTFVVVETF